VLRRTVGLVTNCIIKMHQQTTFGVMCLQNKNIFKKWLSTFWIVLPWLAHVFHNHCLLSSAITSPFGAPCHLPGLLQGSLCLISTLGKDRYRKPSLSSSLLALGGCSVADPSHHGCPKALARVAGCCGRCSAAPAAIVNAGCGNCHTVTWEVEHSQDSDPSLTFSSPLSALESDIWRQINSPIS
jgi:hypothetical protein